MRGGARSADSKVVRFEDYRWQGIKRQEYRDDAGDRWRDVSRYVLAGAREGGPFHLRYFEIGPGGYTTLERHEHEHVVVALRGEGKVRLGERWEAIHFGDVVYVAPNEAHQFRATDAGPFGFLCIVDAERDPPRPLDDR